MRTFIRNQAQALLDNTYYALACTIGLALLSYTAWVSAAIIALITLRKGWRDGGWLLLFALLTQYAVSFWGSSAQIALLSAVITFLPCYIGACVLGWTTSWRAVAVAFLFQVTVAMIGIQLYLPDYVLAQFLAIKAALQELDGSLLNLVDINKGLNQTVLASYLLGLQAVGVVLSASSSLMWARSVQSQLVYPGGFRAEMLGFRASKLGLLLFILVYISAYEQNAISVSILPMFMLYFVLAGISLSFNLFKQKWLSSWIILIATFILLPFVMLPVYVIFGSLDSLFNLRSYLPSNSGKTV